MISAPHAATTGGMLSCSPRLIAARPIRRFPRVVRAAAADEERTADAAASTPRRAALAAPALLALALSGAVGDARPAAAGVDSYNVTTLPVETVKLQMGDEEGALVFIPSTLTFTAGRVYKLHMTNPSSQTHYFTALEFASKTYTILVLANGVEVKGAVSEVALKKGAEATWIFVPIKPGRYPLKCTVKGHTEGGMVGEIVVEPLPGSVAAEVAAAKAAK